MSRRTTLAAMDSGPTDEGAHLTQGSPRMDWPDLPAHVRARVEHLLGAPVVQAATQRGGFSPGVAARVRTADGGRAFVKAAGLDLNPGTPSIHRREAAVVADLPAGLPVPALLGSLDDGDWVALVLEDLPGRHPHLPWHADELDRVLTTVVDLHAELTPTPLSWAPTAWDDLEGDLTHWQRLASQPAPPPGLDGWTLRHLPALVELESGARQACAGDTLLHMDLRSDNLLVTDDDVRVVDWPWACVGHPLLDAAVFAITVATQGGPPPSQTVDALGTRHPDIRGADPDARAALAVALAGYFTASSLEPPPPGLPTLRAFQAAQGTVARQWVRDLCLPG